MTQANSFDKQTIRVINSDIENALNSIATKYGVKISLGNSSFNVAECNTKLNMRIIGLANPHADLLGLPMNIDGVIIKIKGENYIVERVDTSKPKYPIIVKQVGNPEKKYKLSVEQFNQYNKKIIPMEQTEKLFTVKGTRKDGAFSPYLIYDGKYNVTKEYAEATCRDCNRQWGNDITFEVVESSPEILPSGYTKEQEEQMLSAEEEQKRNVEDFDRTGNEDRI